MFIVVLTTTISTALVFYSQNYSHSYYRYSPHTTRYIYTPHKHYYNYTVRGLQRGLWVAWCIIKIAFEFEFEFAYAYKHELYQKKNKKGGNNKKIK